jgi:cytoskeletal protein RodZ
MAGIGSTLREARMRQHLDIVDFEARTKIRGKYLRALEDEEWGLLPGYPFVKGFLRTYADMLGLDGRALVDEFKRQYRDPSDVDLTAPLPSRREARRSASDHARERGDRSRARGGGDRGRGGGGSGAGKGGAGGARPPAALVVFVIAVVLAAVLYFVGNNPRKPTTTNTTTTHTSTTHTSTTTTHSHTTPAAPTRVALRLVPTGSVYVCLVSYTNSANTNGHVRLNGVILTTASTEPIYHARGHFLVTFGNSSIAMYVDGHRHVVPTSSAPTSYSVALGGAIHRLTASEEPHCT